MKTIGMNTIDIKRSRGERSRGATIIRSLGAVLVAGAAASSAFAQDKETRPPKPLTQPDMAILQEAVDTVQKDAECRASYVITTEARPKDIVPNCSDPAYDPYVVRAIESMTYQFELFDGEPFDSDPLIYPFVFGKAPGAPAEDAGTPPVLKRSISPAELSRAIERAKTGGVCDATFTVGVDGKPKDIHPNCDPAKLDKQIEKAIERMEYEPGMKDGKPVEWPDVKQPMNLTNPD
ncbi:MAG: hypothetical protein R3C52_01720 [Hyphomonadaceae bacterium]